ncbi:hypothetical protein [Taibaiella koreensis]|uniref:hypothetical protein n=1 Tax=Taibaiella koreensis TaxID=1268548 RepID=UPI000E59D4AB|nr:hypothetical protein [Taibaiella koreensis]
MKKKDEIAAELKALNAELGVEAANDPVFHTPENYFLDFPAHMTAIIQSMNADTSLLLPVAQDGPYAVPSGYFDTLDQQILARAKAMDAIVQGTSVPWTDTVRETPFDLPAGYFASFEQQLHHNLFHSETPVMEEIQALSPLLADLQKEQPFVVPAGYFNGDAFTRQVKAQQPQAKTAEHPSVRSIKWARWAAAAAVVAIFAVGGLHYLVPGGALSSKASFEQDLAKIPEKNIKEWLSNNMDEADINNLGGSIANISIGGQPVLDNLSEQQIRDYLDAEMW